MAWIPTRRRIFQVSLILFAVIRITTGLSAMEPVAKVGKVAVVGGTGRLGREVVNMLLARGVSVRCLVRSSSDSLKSIQEQNPDGKLEFVTNGDVTDASSLSTLLEGCTACLAVHGATRRSKISDLFQKNIEDTDMSHAKQVNYLAMSLLVSAARESKTCNHIVRITGKGETPYSFFSILINGLGSMAKGWNYEGEQVLRNTEDIDYTIIRPGVMKPEYEPEGVQLQLADNGGDLKVTAVSYKQIAELCLESLFQPTARRTTLTAMNAPVAVQSSLVERLNQVQRDSRKFPDSLIDEHKRAVSIALTSIGVTLALAIVTILRILFLKGVELNH